MTIFSAGFLTNLALTVAVGAQTLFLLRQIVRGDRVLLALLVCFASDATLLAVGTGGLGAVAQRLPWLVPALTVAGTVYLLWFAASAFASALRGQRTLATAAAEATAEGSPAPDAVEVAVLTGQLPVLRPRPDGTGFGVEGFDVDGVGAGAGAGARAGASAGVPAGVGGGAGTALATRVQPRTVRLEVPQSPRRRIVLLALSVSLLNPHAILDLVVMMGTFAQTHGDAKWVFAAGALTAAALWFTVLGWGGRKLAPYMNSPRTWRIVDAVVGVVVLGIAVKVGLTLL